MGRAHNRTLRMKLQGSLPSGGPWALGALALIGAGCAGNPASSQPQDADGGDAGGFGFASSVQLQPAFGPLTVASRPPPAISGGTLLVTRDGRYAVAADPDRDAVYVVDLARRAVASTVTLSAGDEPGRVVEDGAGRVHVALRGGGSLVTLEVSRGTVLARRPVCPAPRGVAWDSTTNTVWVACATGELVSLPAAGGAATRTLVVERDLRDVIVGEGSIAVSQFRSAQLLHLDGRGVVTRRDALPSPIPSFAPHVAWRTVPGPAGTFVAVHQAESTASIVIQSTTSGIPGGPTPLGASGAPYGGSGACGPAAHFAGLSVVDSGSFGACPAPSISTPVGVDASLGVGVANGPPPVPPPPPGLLGTAAGCASSIVASVLTVLGPDGTALVNATFNATLPVDVAVSADGSLIAAVAPGNAFSTSLDGPLFVFGACGATISPSSVTFPPGSANAGGATGTAAPPLTAVAFTPANDIVVQSREPAFLAIATPAANLSGITFHARISLAPDSRDDTGHDVFHTQAGAMIACASCHPEGRDDGHVWTLDGQPRRTPSLRGTIAGTAPYHWPGDEMDLPTLVTDVYTHRMGGASLDDTMMSALTGWVQHVTALPAPAWIDAASAARGKVLFERDDVGCATCHSGLKLTNNKTVDVGTGAAFQVPPLVGVGWRTPLMHDGCATTVADRFGACATPQHGSTASLSSQQLSELISYLETL